MADNRTSDARDITAQEANPSLLKPAIALLRLPERLIYQPDGLLKTGELGHRVRDLPTPKGVQTLIQTTDALLGHNPAPSLAQVARIWWEGCLHADLDRFERTQGQVRQELGRSTRA